MNITREIVEASEEVHSILGAGHNENIYHRAIEREFSERGIPFTSEGNVVIRYKGSPVGHRRPDMFVQTETGTIVIELKAGNNKGKLQLYDYMDIIGDDDNYNVQRGMLIRFNEDVEVLVSP